MPLSKQEFFGLMRAQFGGQLEYEHVLVCDEYSQVLPRDTDHTSRFSRNVPLREPVVSSPMDTVTEKDMAIAMAKQGGLGIIHSAMTPEDQAEQVRRVKTCLNGKVERPRVVRSNVLVEVVLHMQRTEELEFDSFPVVDSNDRVEGLLTRKSFRFCTDTTVPVREIMKREPLTAGPGTTFEQAYQLMLQARKKVLLLIDDGRLAGMYVWSDLVRIRSGSTYNLDAQGHLLVGAAVTVGPDLDERVDLLAAASVDVVVVDSAHGDTCGVHLVITSIKRRYPALDVVGGNISQPDAVERLIDSGADGGRVGQSPGAGCKTREATGAGRAQLTAVYECAAAAAGRLPICADGGIKYPGDLTKAIGAGADCVMIGGLLAGTDESPGTTTKVRGKEVKLYRGMGSAGAMAASRQARERYHQGEVGSGKRIEEGFSRYVQYRGSVAKVMQELIGGLSSGMGYVGARTIAELQTKARFERIEPRRSDAQAIGSVDPRPGEESL